MERLSVALDQALGQVAAAVEHGAHFYEPQTHWNTGYQAGAAWLAYSATADPRFRTAGLAASLATGRCLATKGGPAAPDLGLAFGLAAVNAWRLAGDQKARALAFAAVRELCQRFQPAPVGCLDGQVGGPELLNLPLLWWAAAESGDGRPALLALRHAHTTRTRLDPAGPERGWYVLGCTLAFAHSGELDDLQAARQAADAILQCGVAPGTESVAAAGLLELEACLGAPCSSYRDGAWRLLFGGPGGGPAGFYFYLEALLRLERGVRPVWAGHV